MPCTVVLIRHGQTYWNAVKKFQGQVNIPLNQTGIEQAHRLQKQLADYPIEICYTSPLTRSYETARIALEGHGDVPMVKDERLMEQSYGVLEGQESRLTDHGYELVDEQKVYNEDPAHYVGGIGSESFEQLYARAQGVLDDLIFPEAKRRNCFMVSGHGAIDAAILGRIYDIPLKDFWSAKLDHSGFAALKVEDRQVRVVASSSERLLHLFAQ